MEEIKRIIDTYNGKLYDLCYELLENHSMDEKDFEYICKNYELRKKEKSLEIIQYFSEDEIEQYESAYGDVVNGLINSNIKKCNLGLIKQKEFYKVLWDTFFANFSTTKELAFALYFTIVNKNIPYTYLGKPISMSNDRFRELLEKNESSIEKIKAILKSNYSQRTERASLLLNCLNEIEDLESKVAVLAKGISLFNSIEMPDSSILVDQLLKKIDKKIEELEAQEQAVEGDSSQE